MTHNSRAVLDRHTKKMLGKGETEKREKNLTKNLDLKTVRDKLKDLKKKLSAFFKLKKCYFFHQGEVRK